MLDADAKEAVALAAHQSKHTDHTVLEPNVPCRLTSQLGNPRVIYFNSERDIPTSLRSTA
jgi:hypothetical protein